MTLDHTFDPTDLRPVYRDPGLIRPRLDELAQDLAGRWGGEPDSTGLRDRRRWGVHEWELRNEQLELRLAVGDLLHAAAAVLVLTTRAREVRSRKHQFLARLADADLTLWQGRYPAATMRFIELAYAAEKQPRAVQAMTHLRFGRCEYRQGMWMDAKLSFQWALAMGEQAHLGDDFFDEASFALSCAETRSHSEAL